MPCDAAVVHALAAPPAPEDGTTVISGRVTSNGVDMAGAKAIWRSAAGMAAWQKVITHPEAVDEWAPASLGVKRADRVDPSHMYQKTDFSLLGGLVHIQQQAVTGILWDSSSAQRFSNCWWVEDPAGWTGKVPNDGTDFAQHGQGGWTVEPAAGGGSTVSYAFWTEARMLLPQVQAWAMSKTLPELARAFEQRAVALQQGG